MSHLDLDRLADLLAGEGTDGDVAHVGDCAGCAGRLDELAVAEVEVAAALAALPAPAAPPGLADRLAAAVAAQPPLEPEAPFPTALGDGPGGVRTVTPFPSAARRPRSRTPFAAAAALLVAAGALGGTLLLSGGGTDDATESVAAGGALADSALGVPTSATGQDYAGDPSRLAEALPELLRGSAAARAGAPGAEAVPAPDASALSAETGSGAGSGADSGTTTRSAPGDDPLARLRDPAELAGCLAQLLPPGEDVLPLALDYAAYDGQPALVVVLPGSGAPDKVDVFVVGAECRDGDDRTLFFARLDRPA